METTKSEQLYLKTIYNLYLKWEYVKSADVAKTLNYSRPSVLGLLRKLEDKGLITFGEKKRILLTEEGRLISLIKGIGSEEEKIEIDEYIQRLENVLDQKVNIYSGLQDKIDIYKGHLKEEDRMRKEHPQFFVDPADL